MKERLINDICGVIRYMAEKGLFGVLFAAGIATVMFTCFEGVSALVVAVAAWLVMVVNFFAIELKSKE